MAVEISAAFPLYTEYHPAVPVYWVTRGLAGCFHRFFDTSPISPSGRYLALTQMPFEDRVPGPEDVATIVLIDLADGSSRAIAESRGWDTQLGAQVQWGPTDEMLLYNDMDVTEWRPFGVCMNPLTGTSVELGGTVYMVSPDGSQAASPCLLRTGLTQAGYGVLAPPEHVPLNRGAPDDDGIFVTDVATGQGRLLLSLAEIVDAIIPDNQRRVYRDGDFYGFHVKWNLQGTRLMFVVRWKPHDAAQRMRIMLVTCRADGTDIHAAISDADWSRGGHHPNWCPDGENVMMNLKVAEDGLRFVTARYDGTGLTAMHPDIPGSGHPALRPDGRFIVTDVYQHGALAYGDGTTPIRWVDLQEGNARDIVRMSSLPAFSGTKKVMRVDPHPAWDFAFERVAFNGCIDGRRHVFVADVRSLLPHLVSPQVVAPGGE